MIEVRREILISVEEFTDRLKKEFGYLLYN